MLDITTLQAELHGAIDGFVDEVATALNEAARAVGREAKPKPTAAGTQAGPQRRPSGPDAPAHHAAADRSHRKPVEPPTQQAPEQQEPAPRSSTSTAPIAVLKRSLLNRPNVVLVPSGSRPVLLVEPPISEQHDEGAPDDEHEDDLADRAAQVLVHNVSPLTLEQIRVRLRVKREPLERVMDRLVRDGRARAHEAEGATMYKPPRIEPIRRPRSVGV